MQKPTRRGSAFYVVKRVSARFAAVEPRKQVCISLRTDSEAEAQKRAVDAGEIAVEPLVAAALGGDPTPQLMLSGSAAAYIALHEADARDKGRNQRRIWEHTLHRSIRRLMELIGDRSVDALTRGDALAFRAMWGLRIQPGGLNPASANREIAAVGSGRA
jgi:hypothetical protein